MWLLIEVVVGAYLLYFVWLSSLCRSSNPQKEVVCEAEIAHPSTSHKVIPFETALRLRKG